MNSFDWAGAGFSPEQTTTLDTFNRGNDSVGLGQELLYWSQWVKELEEGDLWTTGELDSACTMRDELDVTLFRLPQEYRNRVMELVDGLDARFRNWTVYSGARTVPPSPIRWWWARIPVRSSQRLYLHGIRQTDQG